MKLAPASSQEHFDVEILQQYPYDRGKGSVQLILEVPSGS